jgi:hypothetical protein
MKEPLLIAPLMWTWFSKRVVHSREATSINYPIDMGMVQCKGVFLAHEGFPTPSKAPREKIELG